MVSYKTERINFGLSILRAVSNARFLSVFKTSSIYIYININNKIKYIYSNS